MTTAVRDFVRRLMKNDIDSASLAFESLVKDRLRSRLDAERVTRTRAIFGQAPIEEDYKAVKAAREAARRADIKKGKDIAKNDAEKAKDKKKVVKENEDHEGMLANDAAEEDHKSGKTREIKNPRTKKMYDDKRARLKKHDETKPK